MKRYSLLAVPLLFACTLTAEQSEEPSRGPDGGTRTRVGGIEILPVAGKPFSGRDSIDWTRNLEDESIVATHLEANLARDGQGRIYRENVSFLPASSNERSKPYEFNISDPATHTRTSCVVATRHCTINNYRAPTSFTPRPTGTFDKGTRELTRENLGSDVVDGLNVVGTRETVSIKAGVVGNSQPLVTTREFWYSPDLQVNLSVTRKDPRQGTQAIHVVNLSRAEPDPSVFQVPADYTVQDQRSGSAKTED
jgi:hypothetical protein